MDERDNISLPESGEAMKPADAATRAPNNANADEPPPLAESIGVALMLLLAAACCWMLYGPFIAGMLRSMLGNDAGAP